MWGAHLSGCEQVQQRKMLEKAGLNPFWQYSQTMVSSFLYLWATECLFQCTLKAALSMYQQTLPSTQRDLLYQGN